MGVMGEGTFIADILCNNQLYIVWGGGYQIWIVIDIFCCVFCYLYVGAWFHFTHFTLPSPLARSGNLGIYLVITR